MQISPPLPAYTGGEYPDNYRRYYAANKDQPRAFYTNGRHFYFGVRLEI